MRPRPLTSKAVFNGLTSDRVNGTDAAKKTLQGAVQRTQPFPAPGLNHSKGKTMKSKKRLEC